MHIGGWCYIEGSERSFIRNRSGVGREERGFVSWKDAGIFIFNFLRVLTSRYSVFCLLHT